MELASGQLVCFFGFIKINDNSSLHLDSLYSFCNVHVHQNHFMTFLVAAVGCIKQFAPFYIITELCTRKSATDVVEGRQRQSPSLHH